MAGLSPELLSPELGAFRSRTIEFLADAKERGVACPAFGAILPPPLHDQGRRWQKEMAEAGWAGLHWPTEYGGQGLSKDHTAIWYEECARAQVAPYLNLQGIVLAGEAILRAGTEDQKRRWLPKTLSGEVLWCQLFSEPDAGSDLASLATAARPDGDSFVVNGQKVWCSNGQFAEMGILMARTDPDTPGHRGISFFCVEMDLEGIDVRPLVQMTGDDEFCEVFLDDVTMPGDALLGPLHGGWKVGMDVLSDERGSSGSSGLITLERRLERLAGLLDSSSSNDDVVRDRILQLLVRGHALKTMLLREDGGPAASSAAKLLRTELEFDAAGIELTLLGADGMLAGDRADRFLYAPGMKIAGGSSEIQRNIIGERVLGLPREPRP
ncbi:MAG: acyl-CoA dehydrogenase family protein [Acidimicrobiales bacterium]